MKKERMPWYVSLVILLGFTIRYIITGNYEFLVYSITIGALIGFLIWSDVKFRYLKIAKWGFVGWITLHMVGGSFKIGGVRIYDKVLINFIGEPYNILRYDQVVHGFCYIVIALILYSVAISSMKDKTSKRRIGLLVFLAGLGVGAINEIIEFSTVAFFNAMGVGNYINNALDLVFNAIGAGIGVGIGTRRSG